MHFSLITINIAILGKYHNCTRIGTSLDLIRFPNPHRKFMAVGEPDYSGPDMEAS